MALQEVTHEVSRESCRGMKICVVVDIYPKLSETFVKAQVEALAARGHEVEVLCRRIGDRSENSTVPIRRWWGALSFLNAPIGLLSYRLSHRVTRSLDRLNADYLSGFDVVLAHFGYTGVRVACTLARMNPGLPLATIYHGHDVSTVAHADDAMSLYDELFRVGALHLPVNEVFCRIMVDAGAPPERTVVHHVGAPLDTFTFTHRGPTTGPLQILSVCRLTEKKGIKYALAALEQFAEDHPDVDWRYQIVGTGELEEALRNQAATLRVANRINFLGAQPHEEVRRLLKEADMFLLPSVTARNGDSEGVPVSLMEAMASGVLVVSTCHSGIPELVEDGVTGFLASERDVDSLADRIAAAAESKDAEAIARAAAAKVQKDYNQDEQLDELERLLKSILVRPLHDHAG